MLEYFWFAVLMIVSIALGWIYSVKEDEAAGSFGDGLDAGQWLIGAFGASVMALVISWERTGSVVLSWLLVSLSQQGAPISKLTAYVLAGVACLVVVFVIPAGASFLAPFFRRKSADKTA